MPVDRILEAELAVEQKSDQGVEGPGGTGGSGSSVSDGVNPFYFLMGGRGQESRSTLSPPPLPSPYNPPNTAWDCKCCQTRSQTSEVGVIASSVPTCKTAHWQTTDESEINVFTNARREA